MPLAERPVLQEIDAALTQRLRILNAYLPSYIIRTRRTPPSSSSSMSIPPMIRRMDNKS